MSPSSGPNTSAPRARQLTQLCFTQSGRNIPITAPVVGAAITVDQAQAVRNKEIHDKVRIRLEDLQRLLNHRSVSDEDKLAYLIEWKALNLFTLQRHLRDRMLAAFRSSALTTVDHGSPETCSKHRAIPVLDGRTYPELLSASQHEVSTRRSERRLTFVKALVMGVQSFREHQASKHRSYAVISKGIAKRARQEEREKEREREREERLRLRALKENRYDEYVSLVRNMKNDRITHLLQETDSYLKALARNVSGGVTDNYHEAVHSSALSDIQQPAILVGGTLKPYQLEGVRWLASLHRGRLNGILADEMGLGKTIQTIAFLSYMQESARIPGPHIILVPLGTLPNWEAEFKQWCPSLKVLSYIGPPKARKALKTDVLNERFNVLLTSFDYMLKDVTVLKKVHWQYVVVDEGHRIKNHNSKLSTVLKTHVTSHNRLILTGTPLQNNLTELWSLLNFILPSIFDSSDNFEQWFNAPFAKLEQDEAMETTEEERLVIIERLHQILRPFLLRRVKADVARQLPRKTEAVVRCALSGWQAHMYRQVQSQGTAMLTSGGQTRALTNVEMQLRKVCLHPYMFHDAPLDDQIWRVSGKFELLDRVLPKLHATGHRVLIFSQMKQLLDTLGNYMVYKNMKFLRLDGTTKAEERQPLLDAFNKANSEFFAFLLTTRAGGLGINLQTADTVIIFDSDWNPQMDAQAQARAHRIGQTSEVKVLRLVSAAPIEERILAAADRKMGMTSVIIQAGEFGTKGGEKSSAKERKEELKRLILEEAPETERNIPTATEINEIIARSEDEFKQFEAFDQAAEQRRQADWTASGNIGLCPPRLDKTVPPWVLEMEAKQAEEAAKAQSLVTDLPRKRKAAPLTFMPQDSSDESSDGSDDESAASEFGDNGADATSPLIEVETAVTAAGTAAQSGETTQVGTPLMLLPGDLEMPLISEDLMSLM
ncbi:SNF2 family N-terminal domain [Carpediemonas membranifera]|uniref:SNF2 family N-terminal domain n=1 Tax=Carpediemonas membranifera TaxID=201153 RepID=A0A8J6DZH2_9EUKA|nr:SNF2 family N-terminal domain [Carpediemonas membranifera]|eukprot:KAG9390713.1 SNF2 family N-terminal domain [Carpediemonas membranifera]